MKFKKHISILLVFFLLISNAGLSFNVHYCGNEVASVSLKTSFSSQDFEKDCCGIVSENDACCKDKVVHFQKKSDNSLLKAYSFNADIPFLIEEWNPIVFSEVSNFKSFENNSYYCDANGPPLFKLYNKYIFYA